MIAEYNVNLENKTKSELILFIKELQDMLKEKDEQIAKYEKIYKEYDCYRWVKELEKKDKIIDLIINEFYKRVKISENCYIQKSRGIENCLRHKNCKECLKQYFKEIAEESSSIN